MPDPPLSAPPPVPPESPSDRQALGLAVAFLLGVSITYLLGRGLELLHSRPIQLVASPVIDLNLAERADLLQLPGIGPRLGDRILANRELQGGFPRVEDLRQVPGVGPRTLERLRPWIGVSPVAAPPASTPAPPTSTPPLASDSTRKRDERDPPLDINRATLAELQRLPGIGAKLAARIVDERGRQPFTSLDDLRRVPGIGAKTLERLRPRVRFD